LHAKTLTETIKACHALVSLVLIFAFCNFAHDLIHAHGFTDKLHFLTNVVTLYYRYYVANDIFVQILFVSVGSVPVTKVRVGRFT